MQKNCLEKIFGTNCFIGRALIVSNLKLFLGMTWPLWMFHTLWTWDLNGHDRLHTWSATNVRAGPLAIVGHKPPLWFVGPTLVHIRSPPWPLGPFKIVDSPSHPLPSLRIFEWGWDWCNFIWQPSIKHICFKNISSFGIIYLNPKIRTRSWNLGELRSYPHYIPTSLMIYT